jgi:transcription initiation factor TFIIB
MSGQNETTSILRIRGYTLNFISKLNLIEEVRDEAIQILEAISQDSDFLSSAHPKGLAAGITYVAAILQNNRISQHNLAGIAEVSKATIHKYYVAIVKKLNLYEPRD